MFYLYGEQVNVIPIFVGDCLKIKNQYEEALDWYFKALKINPKHVLSLWGISKYISIIHR